jgi:hypothetical protein
MFAIYCLSSFHVVKNTFGGYNWEERNPLQLCEILVECMRTKGSFVATQQLVW